MSRNTNSVTRESDKFNLRLPAGMRERVAEQAKKKGRSMNAELVSYVEAGLRGVDPADLAGSIKRIEADVAEIKGRLSKK